jgi:hypothetical protein
MSYLNLFFSCIAAYAVANPAQAIGFTPSDCSTGHQDSTCLKAVKGGDLPPDVPGNRLLYDGPLAGVPATDLHYWGFDFQAVDGVYPPTQRSMYVNRSSDLIMITLTFDIPTGPCEEHCLPGIEFKVGNWHTFFPNVVAANGLAEATLEVGPSEPYGWVIGLWQASNPRLTVTARSKVQWTLADVGLPMHPDVFTSTPGVSYPCLCQDGTVATCTTGPQYSTGIVGGWSHDYYQKEGGTSTCPSNPSPG